MKKLLTILTILALSIIFVQCSYSAMDDKSDRLSTDQSNVFSPGYINATKQHTDEVIRQAEQNARTIDTKLDDMKNKVSNEVAKDASDKQVPELKHKASLDGNTKKAPTAAISVVTKAADSMQYNIVIGSGAKEYDSNNRVIAEVINGTRYVYAGFSNFGTGTIQDAINLANAGDTVIVKSGTYDSCVIKNGVNLYGGYDETGGRDLENAPTIINGYVEADAIDKPTEFNGFTMENETANFYGGAIVVTNSSALIISNTIFNANEILGIDVTNSPFVQIKNNTFNTDTGIQVNGIEGVWEEGRGPHGTHILVFSEYGSQSVVASVNNNFNGSSGTLTYGRSVITSDGDYFAVGKNIDIALSGGTNYDAAINYSNTLPQPNIVTYTDVTQSSSNLSQNFINTTLNIPEEDYGIKPFLADDYKGSQKQLNSSEVFPILISLLKSKDAILSKERGDIDALTIRNMIDEVMTMSSFSAPQEISTQEMQMAMSLANIMKNPTEDQKFMLDTITSLLNDVNKQGNDSASPELKKASDDLLQAVANILIAQAIPDLLKEGDVAAIKGTFAELNTTKSKIMVDYQESVKPYYDEMKKLIGKNMAILQLNNIVSKALVEDKLEPSDIDKILEKLRKATNRSFEEEYMLQQEAKYHKTYIEPSKKILEEKMKAMMKDFTKRMSKMLEAAKK